MTETKANPNLVLERKGQEDRSPIIGGFAIMTPAIEPEYWTYRVRLSEKQSIVGFPKFSTIGIGFAVEEDWNTNLPFTCDADEIFKHIDHNKGDDEISDEDCVEAIRMVQDAAWRDQGVAKLLELAERLLSDPTCVGQDYAECIIRNIRERFCEASA